MSDHSIASIRYNNDGFPVKVVEHYDRWYVISIDEVKRFYTFEAAELYAEAFRLRMKINRT
jgi:hypothetical protein